MRELKELKSNLNIKEVNITNNAFYLFGMGNREKFIYQNGKLTDIEGNERYSWDVKKEIIIPNEYKVILKTKEKNIVIEENENGIYIEKELLPNTDNHINLPDFSSYKYPNVMKVLLNEILFNIKDGVALPNIFVYDGFWLRDGSLVAMVLKETDNLELIKDFILNLSEMYDNQNHEQEMDNLGQALYLISLVSDQQHPLVKKILAEVKSKLTKNELGEYLNGRTDYANQPVYQTAYLNLGLNNLGINLHYDIIDDNSTYRALTWWDKTVDGKNIILDAENYAYLNWASYHKSGLGKLYIGKTTYPLTWEKNASSANYLKMSALDGYYVENKISPVHSWMASEIFLYLMSCKVN